MYVLCSISYYYWSVMILAGSLSNLSGTERGSPHNRPLSAYFWGHFGGPTTKHLRMHKIYMLRTLTLREGGRTIKLFFRLTGNDIALPTTPVHWAGVSCDGTEPMLSGCLFDIGTARSHNSDVFIACLPVTQPYSREHTLKAT